MAIADLTGKMFGELRVLQCTDRRTRHGKLYWTCQCSCGEIKDFIGRNLIDGHSKSCGCNQQGVSVIRRQRNVAVSSTKLYEIWKNMRKRCNRPWHPDYKYYGARGIKVCERWDVDFDNFKADIIAEIGPPKKGFGIDRIENDGNYEPGNVRWATRITQRNNRRR